VRQPAIRVAAGIHHDHSRLEGDAVYGGQIVRIDDEYVAPMEDADGPDAGTCPGRYSGILVQAEPCQDTCKPRGVPDANDVRPQEGQAGPFEKLYDFRPSWLTPPPLIGQEASEL
jgi:hypothetical protein